MKSPFKSLALSLLTLAVIAVALAQAFNFIAGKHREQVQQELEKVLGQGISFDSLEVNLFGRPGFVAREFRIADDARFAATPAIRTKELIMGVSLWNLLFRRIVIDSLTLSEPEFQIITDESGLLNLTALINRKNELRNLPRLKPPAAERKHNPVNFRIDTIRIKDGRIEYVDRSIKEPAELRVKNISLTINGLEPTGATKVSVTASLTEGLSRDVRIEGRIHPASGDLSWLHRGIDLSLRLDSLYVPVVARAIAGLRDKIPRELDVTGPMSLQANLHGTVQSPRLDDINLKIPLFGSSDYNAVINASVEFSERRSWDDAKLQGKLTVEPLALPQLRKLRFFEQSLPAALIAEGNISLYGRFEGMWENLRMGVLVRADKAELRYRDWLRKPANLPVTIVARVSRHAREYQFHDSELVIGTGKISFAGTVEAEPAPRLQLQLRAKDSPAAAWSRLLAPLTYSGVTGNADWNLALDTGKAPFDESWSLSGYLKLTEAVFKHRDNGRRLENVNGQVSFFGKQARFENVRFRLGASQLALEGAAANLFEPRMTFTLRSADLNLADLPVLNDGPPVRLKDASAAGEIRFDKDQVLLTGAVAAPRGSLEQFEFSNLRADMALTSAGLTFKKLSVQTLNGVLRSDGYWAAPDEHARQLQLSSQVEAIEVGGLLAQWIPQLKDRITGQLNGNAQFEAAGADSASIKDKLKGSGETAIRRGVIRNFNLVGQLLRRGDATGSDSSSSRLPPSFGGLINRSDTPFDSFKANFTVENGRIHTDNLVISTPDYDVTGAGWMGFDRSTKWNGSIVLSPRLTQELQRDYRIIRYLLDRRGRLSIAFRLEGKIPDVKVRLENRALAQAFRSGPSTRGDDAGAGKPSQESKDGKNWLPGALERFLKR